MPIDAPPNRISERPAERPAERPFDDRTLASPAAPASQRARYIGVDLARFVAVAGMMAAHLVAAAALPGMSSFEQGAAEIATTLTTGIAAPLFAVLGGLSMVFATRAPLRAGRPGAAVAGLLIRGALLVLIGLLLGMLEVPIVVVLAYYGIAMILVAPAVLLPSWAVAGLAAVLGIAVPPLNALARSALDIVEEGGSLTFEHFSTDPLGAVRGLLLTGTYPALTWAVYLLVGILIARVFISATARGALGRAALVAFGIGAALATAAQLVSHSVVSNLAAFGASVPEGVDVDLFREVLAGPSFGAPLTPELWTMLVATPHSGSPMDLLRTIGISLAVVGLLVAVFDGGRSARTPGPILNVFRTAGAAPLTIYSLHVIATSLLLQPAMESFSVDGEAMPWYAIGLPAFALQIGAALLIGAILAALRKRGPLEAIMSGAVGALAGGRR